MNELVFLSSANRPFPSSLHAYTNWLCVPLLFFVPPHVPAPLISALFNTLIRSAVCKFIWHTRRTNIWQLLRPSLVHPFWGWRGLETSPSCGDQSLVYVVPFRISASCVLVPWCGQNHNVWFITVLTLSLLLILPLLWPYTPSSVSHLQSYTEAFTRYGWHSSAWFK